MGSIRGNKVRVLAVTTDKRSAQLPDVPAIVETFPDFPVMKSWVAIYAPKGTPSEVTQLLAPLILSITESPEFLRPLEANGFERLAVSGPQLTAFTKDELAKWEKLIKRAGIQPQ
ncbi:MAG: hypothetical protein IPI73_24650 [Betaproteobacteria bacterium]|nr:hypothetical protein [Betaproteobacteria bacterium]